MEGGKRRKRIKGGGWRRKKKILNKKKKRTYEIWTPRFLCTPAQEIHNKIPKFKEAQSGFFASQSAQCAFAGS